MEELNEQYEPLSMSYRGNDDTALLLTRDDQLGIFIGYWTPNVPPLAALRVITNLGFLTENGRGEIALKSIMRRIKYRSWRAALSRAENFPEADIISILLESAARKVSLEKLPGTRMCVAMAGELPALSNLLACFEATAPPALKPNFERMATSLFG